MRYSEIVKRLFDVVVSGVLLLILLPVLVILAGLIIWKLGSPVIFSQARPGKNGQLFHMYKFRSMTNKQDHEGNLLSDQERLTSFGRKLRSTSLDELPELWNVLKGDMSLVGPRPLLPEYLPLYNEKQMRRHEVKPGITGWAQVKGRNAIGWEKKFEYDVWYVDHRSIWLDIRILWMTVIQVLRRDGISQTGVATMEKFRGSKQPEEGGHQNE